MSHSYICCLLHIVFITAGRRPWMRDEMRDRLHFQQKRGLSQSRCRGSTSPLLWEAGASAAPLSAATCTVAPGGILSLIHISEPTRLGMISYAVFCLKK